MSKKPVRPGEIAANAKDISINRSSYNAVESNQDTSNFTLFDCVLRPSFVNNYSNFSKNPSEYLIYNSENGALLANYNYEINICSKNSMFFQLSDAGINYVDVYQSIESTVISSGTGLYISIFSDWAIQVNSDYNTQLSAITDWSDKYIKLFNRNLYIKVKGYNSSTYTLSTEFSVNGVLSDPADVGATNGIILVISKTKDLTATFWKNVPTNAISTTKKQLPSINVDNNSSSITINDDTDWSDYSDWTTAIMRISCGGTYVGSYNLTTGVYSHLASAPTGDLLINFSFTQGAGAIDGDYIALDNLYITFYNGETIYLNGIKIQAEDSISKTLYIDEYLNIYDNSGLTQIKTINSLEENCSYINKAFYDYVNYITLATTEDIIYLLDKYAYTKTNILVKDSNSRTLQLSNYTNIDDDAVLDDILTKEVPDINDYTAFGAATSDFYFYDVLSYTDVSEMFVLSSTSLTGFIVDKDTGYSYDNKYYYAKFIPTGHIWKFRNGTLSTQRTLDNDTLMDIYIPLKDLGGDTFLMRESDGTTMSLSEAIKGKMIRKFKIEIDQDWDAAGENTPFEIKDDGSSIFSIDKDGNVSAVGNLNIDGNVVSNNLIIENNLGVSGGLVVESTAEIRSNVSISGDLFVQDNVFCSGAIYDKENIEVYGGIFDRLAAVAGTYYNNDEDKIYARNINNGFNGIISGVWGIVDSLNTARAHLTAFSLNNYGYTAGGNGPSAVVEKYDDSSNSWSNVDTLNTARYLISAFSLNNYGYTAGGITDVGSAVIEKYDDRSNSWSNVSSLNTARYGLSAFSLNNYGYTAGGNGPSAVVEKYDDSSNSWSNVDTLNTARYLISAFSLNNYGYTAGGNGPSAVVEKYDDSSNSWSNVDTLNTARTRLSAFSLNNYGYIAGGDYIGETKLVEKYDDRSNSWSNVSSLNTARYGLSAFSLNNYGYTAGGNGPSAVVEKYGYAPIYKYMGKLFSSNNKVSKILSNCSYDISIPYTYDSIDELDSLNFQYRTSTSGDWYNAYTNEITIATSGDISWPVGNYQYEFQVQVPEICNSKIYEDIWFSVTSLTHVRDRFSGFVINGYIYAVGGWNSLLPLRDVEQYNDSIDEWTDMTDLSFYNSDAAGFELNGYGYLVGGGAELLGSYTATDDSYQYNAVADTWTAKDLISANRISMAGFELNGYGYVAGGITTVGGTRVDIVEQYDDSANNWTTKATVSATKYDSAGAVLRGYGYVIGGYTTTYITTVQKYNDVANSWAAMTVLNTAKTGSGAFSLNDFIYLTGGNTGSIVAVVEQYNDISNIWRIKNSLIAVKTEHVGIALNEYGYNLGGYTVSEDATCEKYSDGSKFSKLTGFAVKFVE